MLRNPFIDAHQDLLSAVYTLPQELRDTNAEQLMLLVSELERSALIEIRVIQAVTRVDVNDPQAVATERRTLENYRQLRLYNQERTHCSNIDRIAAQLRAPHQDSGANASITRLNQVLKPLRKAENVLLDDIEEILDAAITTIRKMRGRLQDAKTEQARFKSSMENKIERIHRNLKQMNTLRDQLIDLITDSLRNH